jgi:hypothetical protein
VADQAKEEGRFSHHPKPRLEWSRRSVRCVLCGTVELKTAGSRCRALCYSMFTLQSGKFDFKPSAPLEEPVGLGGFFLCVRHHWAGSDIISPWFYVGMFTSQGGQIHFRPRGLVYIYKIWLDVSHVPCHLARGSQVSVVFSCEYVNAELEVLLQTTSTFEKLNVFFVCTTPRGSVSNVFPWFYVNM